MDGEYVFTPNEPSAGKYVTVKVATTFNTADDRDYTPDASVHGAVKLGTNGSFQVWTLLRQGYGGQADNGWLDVAAQGVTPVSGREYEVSMVFDYAERRYSALVKDEKGVWQLLMTAARVAVFPIAAKGDRVEHIIFEGKTKFRSLKGSYTSIGPNLRAWSKSNGPQAPIYGIEANQIGRRAQSTGLDQIGRSAGSNLRDWSKSNSLQAPICGIGPNQTVCRLQSMGLDQIEWLFDTTGTERSKNGH